MSNYMSNQYLYICPKCGVRGPTSFHRGDIMLICFCGEPITVITPEDYARCKGNLKEHAKYMDDFLDILDSVDFNRL